MKKKIILGLLSSFLLLTSCFEDLDDNPASNQEIQDFIYRGLNFFYLYKGDTPELADNAFSSEEAKNSFIASYDSPESLFEYLLSPQDRFSVLVSDYVSLENSLSGVRLTTGMRYGLVRYPDMSGNVFGYVRYVLPDTDAASKGVERGMIFNTVDGQQLTENNFSSLLDPTTFSIGLATFDGENITPIDQSIELTKQQQVENPIQVQRVLTLNNEKVGYLMYNSFTRDFDSQLNAAFGNFAAQGIQHLVLDLRYNGGGSVETAVDLSAMITGQFNGEIFYTEEWNADRQEEYANPGLFNTQISTGETINSLNLTTVYILTSGRTASASELVINGLEPYINVVQVGTATTGKFQASFLLYDAPAPNFSRSQANPSHTYAMLPLVFKTLNAAGNTDYIDGLQPDATIAEDFSNLGILGDPAEPLFAEALSLILGTPAPIVGNTLMQEIADDNRNALLNEVMYVDKK